MIKDRLVAELPPAVRDWLERNASDDAWEQLARDLAVNVSAALLTREGEAGVNTTIHGLLCRHPSPAVRELAVSAVTGRLWRLRPVAERVAARFGVSAGALYAALRRRLQRNSASA